MANSDGHILLRTDVDTSGVKKGFTAIQNAGTKLNASMLKLGKTIGITFGVAALVKFTKEAVSLASDVEEVQNVVDVAFGSMTDKMEAFADTAVETYGISRLTAKKTGSTYMAMAKGMGLVDETAADMALSLTGLSADMASFYNVSQEYTDIALKSVFTGETETLKQYGIVMTQTNLQEFARQKGITKSIQAMTQQEQVMLRYQYVMKQTQLAQGDFVRTQDSWANQTRILSERWKEMQIQWGEAFKTIGTLLLPAINKLIEGLTVVGKYAAAAAQNIARLFGKEIDTTTEVSSNISSAVDNQNDLTEAVKETSKAAKGQVAAFDEVNQISKDTSETSTSGGTAGSIAGIGSTKTTGASKTIKDLNITSSALTKQINKLWKALKGVASVEFNSLNNLWNNTLKPFGQWLKDTVLIDILNMLTVGLGNSEEPLENLNTALGGIADHTFESLQWLWENILKPMGEWSTETLLPATLGLVSAALETLDTIVEECKPAFEWIWDTFLVPIRDFAWDTTIAFINLLTDAFKGISDWCKEHPETVENMATVFLGFLAGIWVYKETKKIIGFMSDLITKFKEFGGLKGMFNSIGAAINSPALAIGALVAAGLYWVKNWDKIKKAFTGMEGWQQAIVVILGVAAAVAVLWTALSVGVAAAGIVAGLAALGLGAGILAIGNANEKKAKKTTVKSIPASAQSFLPNKQFGEYSIPGLAKGAVLPANKPFLAQLGDQKNGRNLETPESLLRDIYAEGNAETNALLQQLIQVMKSGMTVNVDGQQLMKINRSAELRSGAQTVTGGFANAY